VLHCAAMMMKLSKEMLPLLEEDGEHVRSQRRRGIYARGQDGRRHCDMSLFLTMRSPNRSDDSQLIMADYLVGGHAWQPQFGSHGLPRRARGRKAWPWQLWRLTQGLCGLDLVCLARHGTALCGTSSDWALLRSTAWRTARATILTSIAF